MVIIKLSLLLLVLNLSVVPAQAQPASGETLGGIEKTRRDIEKEKSLKERIKKEKLKPDIQEEFPAPPQEAVEGEKVFIKRIAVEGVSLFSPAQIQKLVSPLENKELSLKQMREAAGRITDLYRVHGYITSRAYLAPQKIEDQTMRIRVVEGLMGSLEIVNNRYFSSALLAKKISLKKGDIFNYNTLRKNLIKINEHPDRVVRAVLAAGKAPATTDLRLETAERLPVHAGFNWDNFGSRFIEKQRFALNLSHNNLLGRDDMLSLQFQAAQANAYRFGFLRYIYPLNQGLDAGLFVAASRLNLRREFKDSDAGGRSRFYTLYLAQSLLDEENLDLKWNIGFDYKDVLNRFLGEELSRDRMRVARTSLDMDSSDGFGRTIASGEVSYGIPNIMGGSSAVDAAVSRSGAGGRFVKNNLSLLRLQKMPFSSFLLWKNQAQFSPYILTATEQFQIGGVSTVRGYPPAEIVGDRGLASSLEWSFPPYFIPKDAFLSVFSSKLLIRDIFKIALFYDWAEAALRRPQAGEEKKTTLKGAGFGFRLQLPGQFSARVDFGYPIGGRSPADGRNLHTWAEVSVTF